MELPPSDNLKLSTPLKAALVQQLQRVLLHLSGGELSRGAAQSHGASALKPPGAGEYAPMRSMKLLNDW